MHFPRDLLLQQAVPAQLEAVLANHHIDSAVIVGHSLGTAYASYMKRYAPQVVAGLALIDPICCMTHHATIADAFVYQPVGPSVGVCAEEYFIRREIFTSNVISRNFRWHEAALWPSECSPLMPTLLVLSDEDPIVAVKPIQTNARTLPAYARGVRVLAVPGGHGGWIGNERSLGQIAARVRALYT